MRPLLRSVCIAMAAYGESFRKHGPNHGNVRLAISSVGNSWKYIMNSKQRAEMVVDLTTHCDLRFAKAFWSLTEGALLKVSQEKFRQMDGTIILILWREISIRSERTCISLTFAHLPILAFMP